VDDVLVGTTSDPVGTFTQIDVIALYTVGSITIDDIFVNITNPATFTDVPTTYWSWNFIERLYTAGITGGCGAGNYCPDQAVTRG
jgi:hypothetical protein